MDLNLNEQQEILKKTARDFLGKNCPKSLVREMEDDKLGHKPELWKAMADLGWLGLAFPDEYGGAGGSFLDLSVLLEEMGRSLLPSPFLPTVISGLIILEAGNKGQKQRFLPQIAKGTLITTTCWNEQGTEYDVVPQLKGMLQGDKYMLDGSKLFVSYAHIANYLVSQVYTKGGATTLFMIDIESKGLKFTPLLTVAKDKQFEVEFDSVSVSKDGILGELNQGQMYLDRVLPKALVAKSLEMLGGAQQVVEMSTEYAKQRVQFDQPIGRFQAIQHHCADMVIDLEVSRFLAYKTAWMISKGLPCIKEAYMTKGWLSDAYRRIVVLGKQIHGGYGVVTEYDMQLYFRRQKTAELFLGDADFYREKIAQMIL